MPAATSGVTTLTLDGDNAGANTITGEVTDNGSGQLSLNKIGSGTWVLENVACTGNTTVSGGTLRLDMTSGAATVGAATTVTVSSDATLELAGTVASLSSGADRENIVNDSSAPAGLLVSGTNQIVGVVSGSGNLVVGNGSTPAQLTATQILQNTLTIGDGSSVSIVPSGGGEDSASTAVASKSSNSAAAASSDLSSTDSSVGESDVETIQSAIDFGEISISIGEILEDRIVNDDRMAAEDPALNMALLDGRVMTELANIESAPSFGTAGSDSGTITLSGEPSGFSSGSGINFTASPARGARTVIAVVVCVGRYRRGRRDSVGLEGGLHRPSVGSTAAPRSTLNAIAI